MAATIDKESVHKEIRETLGIVPEWVRELPDTSVAAFWGLMRDFYLAETKIPNKYKELIGIAVSGATRCRYCALFHTEGAKVQGATEDEIAEASFMAGLTMLGSTFLNAQQTDYVRFEKETQEIVKYVRQHAKKPAEKPVARA